MESARGSDSLFSQESRAEKGLAAMSMRTFDRPTEPGKWHLSQSAELFNGTVGIVAVFGLVVLFLMAMTH
jgi:hypothetical protein